MVFNCVDWKVFSVVVNFMDVESMIFGRNSLSQFYWLLLFVFTSDWYCKPIVLQWERKAPTLCVRFKYRREIKLRDVRETCVSFFQCYETCKSVPSSVVPEEI